MPFEFLQYIFKIPFIVMPSKLRFTDFSWQVTPINLSWQVKNLFKSVFTAWDPFDIKEMEASPNTFSCFAFLKKVFFQKVL